MSVLQARSETEGGLCPAVPLRALWQDAGPYSTPSLRMGLTILALALVAEPALPAG